MPSGKFVRQLGLAIEIPMTPIAGAFLGYLIDDHYHTGTTFTLIFCLVGIFGSIINIVRLAREMKTPPVKP